MTIREMLESLDGLNDEFADRIAPALVALTDSELVELIRGAFSVAATRMSNVNGDTKVGTIETHFHALTLAVEAFKRSTDECTKMALEHS